MRGSFKYPAGRPCLVFWEALPKALYRPGWPSRPGRGYKEGGEAGCGHGNTGPWLLLGRGLGMAGAKRSFPLKLIGYLRFSQSGRRIRQKAVFKHALRI